jgi:hypothetical protein
MGFMDKAKAAAEQAAEKAKGGIQDVQAKRELGQAYAELGETAFRLADAGAISHPELQPIVERIRTLKADEGSNGSGAATNDAAATASPPASSQPPAMPS